MAADNIPAACLGLCGSADDSLNMDFDMLTPAVPVEVSLWNECEAENAMKGVTAQLQEQLNAFARSMTKQMESNTRLLSKQLDVLHMQDQAKKNDLYSVLSAVKDSSTAQLTDHEDIYKELLELKGLVRDTESILKNDIRGNTQPSEGAKYMAGTQKNRDVASSFIPHQSVLDGEISLENLAARGAILGFLVHTCAQEAADVEEVLRSRPGVTGTVELKIRREQAEHGKTVPAHANETVEARSCGAAGRNVSMKNTAKEGGKGDSLWEELLIMDMDTPIQFGKHQRTEAFDGPCVGLPGRANTLRVRDEAQHRRKSTQPIATHDKDTVAGGYREPEATKIKNTVSPKETLPDTYEAFVPCLEVSSGDEGPIARNIRKKRESENGAGVVNASHTRGYCARATPYEKHKIGTSGLVSFRQGFTPINTPNEEGPLNMDNKRSTCSEIPEATGVAEKMQTDLSPPEVCGARKRNAFPSGQTQNVLFETNLMETKPIKDNITGLGNSAGSDIPVTPGRSEPIPLSQNCDVRHFSGPAQMMPGVDSEGPLPIPTNTKPSKSPGVSKQEDSFQEGSTLTTRIKKKNKKRRVRKPFSVVEVEALIEGVEELGAGRWSDIKKVWFGTDNNRTSQDLKDKWRSLLLTTACQSHRKQRGEHLPPALLKRLQKLK